jgi:hypothetical protein
MEGTMSLPTLIVMTPDPTQSAGAPPPWACSAAMDQTAVLLAHWRAHGWPVARIGNAAFRDEAMVAEPRPEDVTAPVQTGPIVLSGQISAKALLLSAEIGRSLGLPVYAPAETVFALGVSDDEACAARDASARILPLQDLFAAIREEAVSVN